MPRRATKGGAAAAEAARARAAAEPPDPMEAEARRGLAMQGALQRQLEFLESVGLELGRANSEVLQTNERLAAENGVLLAEICRLALAQRHSSEDPVYAEFIRRAQRIAMTARNTLQASARFDAENRALIAEIQQFAAARRRGHQAMPWHWDIVH
mmetsp:Transcript_12161/g.38095  ORF Transcript_12161/g.38095 Transcript_12161/m.38095 type:complete len:155 (+) Transcript_12161:72-536(+)